MKKTENINLGGYAFVIEEDAYHLLNEYLGSIKANLKDDAEEISNDIEERIAEIFNERSNANCVISTAMVEEAKKRIGNPTDISSDNQDSTQKTNNHSKLLYRDMEKRVLGGVCSGLGNYFSIDPALLRILFAVFFLLGMMTRFEILTLISMFGYLILWVAMPAARTVEEKCRMKGKPMKLENFITDMNTGQFRKEVSDLGNSPAVRKAGRVMSGIIGVIIMIAGFAGLMGCFFIPLVPEIFSKHVNLGNLIYGTPLAIASRIIYDNIFWWIVTTMVSILSIWFLYNGAMMAFNFKSPSWKPGLILFLAWIVSILCIAGWSVKIVSEMLPLII